MISTQQVIYCINPNCDRPINAVGDLVCANCQTPLVYRYLWATGSLAAKITPGIKVADRYEAIAPQVWLDTQPGFSPDVPKKLPPVIIPYLRLYPERLHLPQVYGFVPSWEAGEDDILLLENVPIDEQGHLYPSLTDAWKQATAVRQVYWLWQILQLWKTLSELGLGQSLLISENLRVQGWCVRLLELHATPTEKPIFRDLAHIWQPLAASAKIPVAGELSNIVQQMNNSEVEFHTIATQLNALLLSTAGELPLTLQVVGATDTGMQLTQNEDTCFPHSLDNSDDSLLSNLSIVCDGIGGHQGGEVASQLAVQSLKLQMRALLAEVAQQPQIVPPNLFQEQLEACLRVVNNVISYRNDEQKRQGKERMATTLVMAVQVPQRVLTASGWQSNNAHELYLVNVGDSRAYWITHEYCQQLTVDDDVATREVRSARCLYHQALQRPDAHALTQALGSRDADSLRFGVKRLILEEDGILLLCSDGLSDNNWVEKSWQHYAVPILKGEMAIADAVSQWIDLANTENGHDNISVVLTLCRLSKDYLVPIPKTQPLAEIPKELEPPEIEESFLAEIEESALAEIEPESTLTESSQALLDLELTEEPSPPPPIKPSRRRKSLLVLGSVLALLVGSTSIGLLALWQLSPQTWQQMCQKLPQQVKQLCPPQY
ncbi:protein phosphatase 2C domain-containing protein [Nostoc sp. UHCC 0870]|uniref:protein phosphatase 2C domain-containing protein n=1 Tax=Nostoc sp. UHCC 0870 TaxID=2914041 RepID=UPI001EDEA9F9|nr:protein phosphatase 2C domain-containing protein [Nostoc sp. UHCC 0870]UKO96652.1 protein phosphatase 2C domain-containing protein [Nostoc sp. UHCC 0870]